jgi:hypothetical protein
MDDHYDWMIANWGNESEIYDKNVSLADCRFSLTYQHRPLEFIAIVLRFLSPAPSTPLTLKATLLKVDGAPDLSGEKTFTGCDATVVIPVYASVVSQKPMIYLSSGAVTIRIRLTSDYSQQLLPVPPGLTRFEDFPFLSAVVQLLFHIPRMRHLTFSLYDLLNSRSHADELCLSLLRVFAMLQLGVKPCSVEPMRTCLSRCHRSDPCTFATDFFSQISKAFGHTDSSKEFEDLFSLKLRSAGRNDTKQFGLLLPVTPHNMSLETALTKLAAEGRQISSIPSVLWMHIGRFPVRDRAKKIPATFTFPVGMDFRQFMADPIASESYQYQLLAVVVHEGDVQHGVYGVHLRPGPEDSWFAFDNDHVFKEATTAVVDDNYGGRRRSTCSALLLEYVRVSALPSLFHPVPDDVIPFSLRQEFHRDLIGSPHDFLIPEIVHAVLINEDFLRTAVRRNHFDLRGDLEEEDLTIAFRIDIEIRDLYSIVAKEFEIEGQYLKIFPISGNEIMEPLDDMRDRWRDCQGPSRSARLFVTRTRPSTLPTPLWQVLSFHHSLRFILTYAPGLHHPIQFLFSVYMPENCKISEIFPKYYEFCELPSHAELRAYTIAAPFTVERLDPEGPLRKTCQFIVVHPKDLATWARYPGVDVSADIRADDEGAPVFYRPSENPRSAKKYLALFDDVTTLSISYARPFRTVTVIVPRSLAIPDFHKFVGVLGRPKFHLATHAILYFEGDSKEQFIFEFDTIGKCFSGFETEPRLTVFAVQGQQLSPLSEWLRLKIRKSDAREWKDLLFPSHTTVREVLERFGHPDPPCRLVGFLEDIYDGIILEEVTIAHIDFINPVIVDRIPDDQLEMKPADKLIPISYIAFGDDDGMRMGSEYLRVAPREPFRETRTATLFTRTEQATR